MKTYKYNFWVKTILRYANIPVNIILIIYTYFSVISILNDWRFVIALLINLILIFFLNRFYFRIYKYFPFRISVSDKELYCSNFMFNNKEINFKFIDIENINGGIFSGRPFMPLYISLGKNKIGISPHIKDYNKLLTTILTNIKKELYENLLDQMITLSGKNIENKNRNKK